MMKKLYPVGLLLTLLTLSACHTAEDGNLEIYPPGTNPDEFGERYTDYGENKFIAVTDEPVSTFSVDSDGASYSNMRRFVNLGQRPPVSSVRVEEYLNYFTFDYPEPADGHHLSTDTEVTLCPWNADHLLLRIGLKGKNVPESELPPTNYVFLIDVSGSMNSPDKLGILKEGFSKLVDDLGQQDRVAIVVYAGAAGVALPSTSCDEKSKIKSALAGLQASGSTAGGEGIITAYDIAVKNYIPGGNNRIILGSDGDFNVGLSSTEELVALIESRRDMGIYLTVLGVGSGNLNDSMMEQLANKGNGTYEYIDNAPQMDKIFIHERLKFYTIAQDCKIQLEFNPAMVEKYRLIGYENRALDNEDFEDDSKDAGEIGIGQTVTALYELIPAAPQANDPGSYARFDIRYKKPGDDTSILLTNEIGTTPKMMVETSENTRFAASVAAFGMLLKNSEFSGTADKQLVLSLGEGATGYDPYGYRKEYLELVKKVNIK